MIKVLQQSHQEEISFLSYDEGTDWAFIKVKVSQSQEKNLANEGVIKLLSSLWKIKKSDIELLKGQTKRNKIFLIERPNDNLIKFIENEGSLWKDIK
jgi:uncharacterized protein YggU (UPF0235/DUF167 family)